MPPISPTTPLDGPMAGSSARGTPIASSSPSSHSSVSQIHQQRAARVGRVGHVHARQVPGQPAVDRARRQLAGLGARARARQLVEQPRELGAREVRRERQARLRAEAVDRAERRDPLGAARVLPHDRVGERAPALALPQHDRLALVGDADRRDVGRRWRRPPRSASPMHARERARISPASCSTQPGRGVIWRCSCCAVATVRPRSSKSMQRLLVVPWSSAAT